MPTATIDLSFYCKEGGKEIFLNFQSLANKNSKGDPSDFLYHYINQDSIIGGGTGEGGGAVAPTKYKAWGHSPHNHPQS